MAKADTSMIWSENKRPSLTDVSAKKKCNAPVNLLWNQQIVYIFIELLGTLSEKCHKQSYAFELKLLKTAHN